MYLFTSLATIIASRASLLGQKKNTIRKNWRAALEIFEGMRKRRQNVPLNFQVRVWRNVANEISDHSAETAPLRLSNESWAFRIHIFWKSLRRPMQKANEWASKSKHYASVKCIWHFWSGQSNKPTHNKIYIFKNFIQTVHTLCTNCTYNWLTTFSSSALICRPVYGMKSYIKIFS